MTWLYTVYVSIPFYVNVYQVSSNSGWKWPERPRDARQSTTTAVPTLWDALHQRVQRPWKAAPTDAVRSKSTTSNNYNDYNAQKTFMMKLDETIGHAKSWSWHTSKHAKPTAQAAWENGRCWANSNQLILDWSYHVAVFNWTSWLVRFTWHASCLRPHCSTYVYSEKRRYITVNILTQCWLFESSWPMLTSCHVWPQWNDICPSFPLGLPTGKGSDMCCLCGPRKLCFPKPRMVKKGAAWKNQPEEIYPSAPGCLSSHSTIYVAWLQGRQLLKWNKVWRNIMK